MHFGLVLKGGKAQRRETEVGPSRSQGFHRGSTYLEAPEEGMANEMRRAKRAAQKEACERRVVPGLVLEHLVRAMRMRTRTNARNSGVGVGWG